VDKTIFLHRLNGLRVLEGLVQALFLGRMLTGQKTGSAQAGQFRTFNPVDMHGFIHSRASPGSSTRIHGGKTGRQCRICMLRQRCRRGFQESRFVSHDGAGFFSFWSRKKFQEASGSLASSIDRRRRRRRGRQGEVAEADFFFGHDGFTENSPSGLQAKNMYTE
jgi:hypothetical protein